MFLARLSVCVALAGALSGAQALTPYGQAQLVTRPGFDSTFLWDVDDGGTMVGISDSVGFVLQGGTFTTIAHPLAVGSTTATGIAADGTIVGSAMLDDGAGGAVERGYLLQNGVFTDFAVAQGTGTAIRHVSDNGRYLTGTWTDGPSIYGFAYDRVTAARVDFVAPGVAGFYIVQGANDAGLVTGSYSFLGPGGPVSAAIVHDMAGAITTDYPSLPGAARPRFRDINDAGVIVGYDTSSGLGLVTDLVTTQLIAAPSGWAAPFVYGLNDTGTIVGYVSDPLTGQFAGWFATAVPEPATWALWGLGLAGLAASRRGRARASG